MHVRNKCTVCVDILFSFCHNSRSTALRQLWRCITQSSSRSLVFTAAPMLGCMPPSATSTRSRGLGLSCHHHGYQSSVLWRRLRWQNKAVSHSKEHWSERSEGADRKSTMGGSVGYLWVRVCVCVSVCLCVIRFFFFPWTVHWWCVRTFNVSEYLLKFGIRNTNHKFTQLQSSYILLIFNTS